MRNHDVLIIVGVLALGLVSVGSCTKSQDSPADSQDNTPVKTKEAYLYSSKEGHFQVMMPSGCSRVDKRAMGEAETDAEGLDGKVVQVTVATCDRFDKKGQGCSVMAIFNLTDGQGGNPGPPEVLRQVQKFLDKFGVQVQHQSQVSREFAEGRKMEGIDVKATVPDKPGQFWVRGLLSGSDVYLLAAWNDKGGLWDDPAYQKFFNSFVPTDE